MTTYKNALKKLVTSRRPAIVSNDDIILLKGSEGYSLVRNDGINLIQTRYKTVQTLEELEDEWMDKNAVVDYDEDFKDEDEAGFKFVLLVIASTHRDITL